VQTIVLQLKIEAIGKGARVPFGCFTRLIRAIGPQRPRDLAA